VNGEGDSPQGSLPWILWLAIDAFPNIFYTLFFVPLYFCF